MTMNNILTSGGLDIMSFLTIHIFRKYVTFAKNTFANQQNAIPNFESFECIEMLLAP